MIKSIQSSDPRFQFLPTHSEGFNWSLLLETIFGALSLHIMYSFNFKSEFGSCFGL